MSLHVSSILWFAFLYVPATTPFRVTAAKHNHRITQKSFGKSLAVPYAAVARGRWSAPMPATRNTTRWFCLTKYQVLGVVAGLSRSCVHAQEASSS
ncbi:hypothetical protein EV127DRAFT_477861 [Xylaria flabelliformis]|nr:hypothetical protein EV127DRAFT_477861 [Xylaria flabelliformis]